MGSSSKHSLIGVYLSLRGALFYFATESLTNLYFYGTLNRTNRGD
jgi:hypothetical protein